MRGSEPGLRSERNLGAVGPWPAGRGRALTHPKAAAFRQSGYEPAFTNGTGGSSRRRTAFLIEMKEARS